MVNKLVTFKEEKRESLLDKIIDNQPRQFSKSTLITNEFLAKCKMGESVELQVPDYVCFSRKKLQGLIEIKQIEMLDWFNRSVIGYPDQKQRFMVKVKKIEIEELNK